MLDLIDYTTYDEIRATVGLSSDELPDTVLSLELYANALELDLDSISMASGNPLKTTFLSLSGSIEDTRIYNLTRMFVAYSVSAEVAVSLSMRAPKDVSDSKVTLTRFSPEATWQDVVEALKVKLKSTRDRLEAIGRSQAETPQYIYKVIPDYDPVTGE